MRTHARALTAGLLLALTACSADPAADAKAGPLTAMDLKAALLTSEETPSGFEVYRTTAAEPSGLPAGVWEKVQPAECAVLRNPEGKARAETVTAAATLERPSEDLAEHRMALAAWSEADAKARMAVLRSALEKCGAIRYENVDSNGPRTSRFVVRKAPELGDESLRYDENSTSSYQGLTVVRVRGVLVFVEAGTLLGPGLTAEQREDLTPGPEEQLIRAQVDKVERTLH